MNLGNWLTPASQAVTGYLQGQQQKQQADQQAALQQYAMKRQQEQDTLRQQLEQRQQSQLEQQTAIKNRLQGVIPSGTPIVPDTRIMGAPAGPGESISRDESLGRMETPSDPNAFQTSIPLPDPGNIHQAILDKGRKASGVPGFDLNFDDSLEGHKERAKSSQNEEKYQAAMDRLTTREGAIDARTANTQDQIGDRQATHDETTLRNNKALLGIKGQQVMQQIGARGAQTMGQIEARGTQARETQAAKPLPQGTTGTGGGKQTDKQRMLDTYANLMERSAPIIEQTYQHVRPAVITLAINHPEMGNIALNPEERSYLQAFRDYSAGVNHQESGARVSKEQMMRDYLRHGIVVGDDPAIKDQKMEAIRQKTHEARIAAGAKAGTATPVEGPAAAKKTVPDQAAYDELRKSLTAAQIAARYNLATGITAR